MGMATNRTLQRPFQFRLRTLLILTAVVGAFFWLVASVRIEIAKNDPRGPVLDRSEWPISLNQFLEDASAAGVNPEPVSVYLARVDWTEHYYCWQMHNSPELLALMTQRWSLAPANASGIAILWRDMPTAWASQRTPDPRRYLARLGGRSDNLVVMIDDSTDIVYVWYWFNF
jgi:hypothetical protein